MVSTAMRWPASTARSPNASMKVDFPTPGDPEIPMRSVPRGAGRAPSRAERGGPVGGPGGLDQGDRLGEGADLPRPHPFRKVRGASRGPRIDAGDIAPARQVSHPPQRSAFLARRRR